MIGRRIRRGPHLIVGLSLLALGCSSAREPQPAAVIFKSAHLQASTILVEVLIANTAQEPIELVDPLEATIEFASGKCDFAISTSLKNQGSDLQLRAADDENDCGGRDHIRSRAATLVEGRPIRMLHDSRLRRICVLRRPEL